MDANLKNCGHGHFIPRRADGCHECERVNRQMEAASDVTPCGVREVSERCPICERLECRREQYLEEYDGSHAAADAMETAASECARNRIDWRARALAAEAERDRVARELVELHQSNSAVMLHLERDTIERVAAWLEEMYAWLDTDVIVEKLRSGSWKSQGK
jgi:hypothetical protein